LRHGFPLWFGRARRSAPSSRNASGSTGDSPAQSGTPIRADFNTAPSVIGTPQNTDDVSIVRILEYIRSTFSEESILDSLPLETAANPGAYHAWRTHRAPVLQTQQSTPSLPSPVSSTAEKAQGSSVLGTNKRPGEWNWEGVWEERVKRAVKASLSESALFGTGVGEDIVRLQTKVTEYIFTRLLDPLSRGRPRDDGEDEEASGSDIENCRSITSRNTVEQ
jgi:hypothetical protein